MPDSSPYCGLWGDLSLFYVDETTYYKKADSGIVETLNLEGKSILPRVFGYYHLKFARADFGIANYDLSNNKKSVYLPKTWVFLWHLTAIPLNTILSSIHYGLSAPPEVLLSIIPRRENYRKEAMRYLWTSYRSLGRISLLISEEWSYLCRKSIILRKVNTLKNILSAK